MTIVFKPVVLPADMVGVKPGSLGPCLGTATTIASGTIITGKLSYEAAS